MKNNSLIILDWDDTLFPTSWLVKNSIDLTIITDIQKYKLYFAELDNVLYNLLIKLLSIGQVIIITNAMSAWINLSASTLLPNSYNLIQKNIEIISARGSYQNKSNNINDWKRMAFKDEFLKRILKKNIRQIISIGDAEYEYHALINLSKYHKYRRGVLYLKAIKLVNSPSYGSLVDQLEVITKQSPQISLADKHLDLVFKSS